MNPVYVFFVKFYVVEQVAVGLSFNAGCVKCTARFSVCRILCSTFSCKVTLTFIISACMILSRLIVPGDFPHEPLFPTWTVIVFIVLIYVLSSVATWCHLWTLGERCFGKNRLVHRRFSVDFWPTFFNQLNGWSLLFELDLKSRCYFIKWRRQTILTLRRTLRRTLWRTEDVGYHYIGGATLHISTVHFLVGKIGGRYGGR